MRMIALETCSYSRTVGIREDPVTLEDVPIRHTVLLNEGAYYALPEDLATEIVEAGIGYWEGDEKPMTRKQRAKYEKQARAAAEIEAIKASAIAKRKAGAPDAKALAAEVEAEKAKLLAARAAKAVDPSVAAAEVEAEKAALVALRVAKAIEEAAAATAASIKAEAEAEATLARRAAAKEARR